MQHLTDYLLLPEQPRAEFRASLTPRETVLLDRAINELAAQAAPDATSTHDYTPYGAAVQIVEDPAPELVASGPAGTGKSRACLERLHRTALEHPGMRGLIIRKTATSLTSTALVTWNKYVVPEDTDAGRLEYFGGNKQEPAGYRYANGSRIDVGGMDKATRIMSSEYDLVYVQEAIELTEDDWELITTRLRNGVTPHQQIIGDTNPDRPTHWLKRRCDDGRARMIHCAHQDNPTLYDPDTGEWTPAGVTYRDLLAKLTGVRRARYLEGKWTGADGLVYPDWTEAVHLIDPFPIPDDWPRYWAVDFGYTNPFVCQHWAVDDDGRAHLYREWYRTQRTVEAHAADILATVAPAGEWAEPKPQAVICDHDAEGRATLEHHTGLKTKAAHKAVTEGIQAVQARLAPAGDGKPRLYVHRGALVELDSLLDEAKKPTCTAQEFSGYVWPKDVDGKENKEQPTKVDDHGLDALRYLVAHLDLNTARTRVRFLG